MVGVYDACDAYDACDEHLWWVWGVLWGAVCDGMGGVNNSIGSRRVGAISQAIACDVYCDDAYSM